MALTIANSAADAAQTNSFIGTNFWLEGQKLKIVKFEYRIVTDSGRTTTKSPIPQPVAVTEDGKAIFLKSLYRARVTADGEIIRPTGSLNLLIERAAQMPHENDQEVFNLLANVLNKDIIVNRGEYIALNDTRRFPAHIINFNFIGDIPALAEKTKVDEVTNSTPQPEQQG